jgi:signal transduction histidine kinase
VSLIPHGIAATIVYKYVHDKTRDEVLRQLRATAHGLNEKLDLLLTKRRFRLVDFSSDGFIRDCVEQMSYSTFEYSKISEELNTHLIINKKSLDPDILEIEILNHGGKVIASTSQEQRGKDKSHEDYFRIPFLSQEQQGPYFANDLNTLETSDKLQLVFSTILSDKTFHRPLGILVTKVKGEILQDILEVPEHQSDKEGFVEHYGEIYIVNSDKLMIASSDNYEGFHLKKIVDTMEIQAVLDSRGEFSGICENYKGVQVLCTALYVPETNWVILSEKDVKEASLPLAKIKYIFAIAGGVAMLMVFIFALIVSHNINTVIKRLIKGTKRIASGDLTHLITVGKRKDEIGELSESFIDMSGKLKVSHERLEEHRRTLEQKVEDKTLELRTANKKLQEQDEMKTDFLSVVSHELRTPLSLVLGFASIINDRFENIIFPNIKVEDSKVQRATRRIKNDLNIIISEGKRLTDLLDNLLDITKIEAGKVDWKMESISVNDVIESATATIGSAFEQNKLELIMDVEDELPLIVGDRNRLTQVMINLISNAAKFTEKGSITCRVRKLNNEIMLSVIDTGIGIAETDQERIFDKFRQVGDVHTDKTIGTGLGLSICKQIVEHHSGRIWVESKPGKGSNFSFTLPCSDGG